MQRGVKRRGKGEKIRREERKRETSPEKPAGMVDERSRGVQYATDSIPDWDALGVSGYPGAFGMKDARTGVNAEPNELRGSRSMH